MRPLDSSEARRKAAEMMQEDADASLRSIARVVGLSPATVQDVRDRIREGKDPAPTQRQPRAKRHEVERFEGIVAPNFEEYERARMHVLNRLRRDPSIISTDTGWMFLRWLEAHTKLPEQHEPIIRRIPLTA